jgi:hypothetical protein
VGEEGGEYPGKRVHSSEKSGESSTNGESPGERSPSSMFISAMARAL